MHRRALLLVAVVVAALAASVAAAATARRPTDTRLSLVAYSTPREAYDELIPEFQETQAGDGVSFSQSYGASGDQARAVTAGLKADVVALSLAPDVDELVTAGLVDAKWKRQSYRGMVTNSVVVFVVRDGNPKKIRGWNDLIKPGVQVVTPNPFTSGGARWNVMAAYGARRKLGKTDKQAQALPAEAVQERRLAGQERPRLAEHVPLRQGRRPARLRERGDLRAARGQKPAVRDPALDDPDREPDRGPEDERPQGRGERVPPLPADAGRAADVRRERLPAGGQERRAASTRRSSRRGPGSSRSTSSASAAGTKVQKRFFDPRNGIMAGIERQVGGVTG